VEHNANFIGKTLDFLARVKRRFTVRRKVNTSEKTGKNEGPNEPEDEFQAVLDALGTEGDGSVLLWRHQTATEPHGFAMVARIPIRDFDPWAIGERFGGGRYRFDVMSSRNRYVKKGIERTVIAAPAGRGGTAAAPAAGFDPISMLIRSSEQAAAFQQAVMLALIQNMGHGGAGSGGGLGVADIVAVMREAREQASVPAPPHEQMLELFREGMKLGKGMDGSGDGEESGLSAMFPKLLDVLTRVLPAPGTSQTPAAPNTPGARPALGAAPGGRATPPGAVSSSGDPVNVFLTLFSPKLIAAASSGQDPMQFARLVVMGTPRGPMLGALRSIVFATPEQRRQAFAVGAPELLPYAEWIDRASEAARSFLSTHATPFPRTAPPTREPEPIAVPAAATDGELENEEDEEDEEEPEGCDNAECTDAECENPDHFDGCDDPACNNPACNNPDHFEDEPSKDAAIARQSRAG
jgi:hypothetical protein